MKKGLLKSVEAITQIMNVNGQVKIVTEFPCPNFEEFTEYRGDLSDPRAWFFNHRNNLIKALRKRISHCEVELNEHIQRNMIYGETESAYYYTDGKFFSKVAYIAMNNAVTKLLEGKELTDVYELRQLIKAVCDDVSFIPCMRLRYIDFLLEALGHAYFVMLSENK